MTILKLCIEYKIDNQVARNEETKYVGKTNPL